MQEAPDSHNSQSPDESISLFQFW
uniref:Uncharacterized protein n=1 Tax=Arundo donax TaxID=35708 RepID=A0A0A9G1P2_ARUDO